MNSRCYHVSLRWHGDSLYWQMIRWRNQVSMSSTTMEVRKTRWPAQSIKTSLGQRDAGQESSLTTVRMRFPNATIKGRFWASRSGVRSETLWFWYMVSIGNTAWRYYTNAGYTMVMSWPSMPFLGFLCGFLGSPSAGALQFSFCQSANKYWQHLTGFLDHGWYSPTDPFSFHFPQTYFTLLVLACVSGTHVLAPDPMVSHTGSGTWEIKLMRKQPQVGINSSKVYT